MANFTATARTNYFEVTDESAFREALADLPELEIVTRDHDATRQVAILAHTEDGGWPSWEPGAPDDDGDDEDVPLDLPGRIAPHLKGRSIAVLFEVGNEKLRYVSGHAVAVNSSGEVVHVDLCDIFALASSKLGGSAIQTWY